MTCAVTPVFLCVWVRDSLQPLHRVRLRALCSGFPACRIMHHSVVLVTGCESDPADRVRSWMKPNSFILQVIWMNLGTLLAGTNMQCVRCAGCERVGDYALTLCGAGYYPGVSRSQRNAVSASPSAQVKCVLRCCAMKSSDNGREWSASYALYVRKALRATRGVVEVPRDGVHPCSWPTLGRV